jgi:hypothetical protein
MSISLVACCSSLEYWERWGNQFCSTIEGLQTKPDEVIVASLVPLPVPDYITNIQSEIMYWDSINDGIRHASSEWVWPVGTDDLIDPHALDDIDFRGDVIAVSGVQSTGHSFFADPEGFRNILHIGHNPMRGSMMFRREVGLALQFRRVKNADWMLWSEIRHNGYEVQFDPKVRFTHVRHAEAMSVNPDAEADRQVEVFKGLLLDGKVKAGAEWPPVLLD